MARIRREFIQIDQRLFNDPRFFMLTEFEQITYIKSVSMAKQTGNRIPKDWKAIGLYSRTNRSETEIKSAIERIKEIFDNFKENKYFYYFDNFDLRYFQNSKNHGVEEDKEEEEDKDNKPPKKQGSKESVFNDKEKAILEAVRAKTNIYALIEDFKNTHSVYPPKEMLLRVCQQFLDKMADIKEPYPYLRVALHRIAQDEESLNWKTQGMAQSIKDILMAR